MTRPRSLIEAAAGKLKAAIQKEWQIEAGAPESAASENVMHKAYKLLHSASKLGSIASILGAGSVLTFLGEKWVKAHPRVLPYMTTLESDP
jgi:hypothetical protein